MCPYRVLSCHGERLPPSARGRPGPRLHSASQGHRARRIGLQLIDFHFDTDSALGFFDARKARAPCQPQRGTPRVLNAVHPSRHFRNPLPHTLRQSRKLAENARELGPPSALNAANEIDIPAPVPSKAPKSERSFVLRAFSGGGDGATRHIGSRTTLERT